MPEKPKRKHSFARMFNGCLLAVCSSMCLVGMLSADEAELKTLFDMQLEELLLVNVGKRATFSDIPDRLAPASISTIGSNDIKRIGARRLNEALDIWVPNAMISRHHPAADHLGIRGINSDVEDKELLLVNGRLMNQHAFKGAEMERDTPLLGDINFVDVIRGPSSSLYGGGALMGVLNLQTYNARTFLGSDITFRGGHKEDFRLLEVRHTQLLDNQDGIFTYAGIADYRGASPEDAPMRVMRSYTDADGQPYVADDNVPASAIANDYSSLNNDPEIKLHIEYNSPHLDLWFRYLDTSQHNTPRVLRLVNTPKDQIIGRGIKLRQATLTGNYHWRFNDWTVESLLSIDKVKATVTREIISQSDRSATEKEIYFKNISRRQFGDLFSLTLGLELSIEDTEHFRQGNYAYQLYGIYAEGVWTLTPEHELFLGTRYDSDRFSKDSISPRLAWVWGIAPNRRLKTILSRSSRFVLSSQGANFTELTKNKAETETLESLELRYEQEFGNSWSLGLGSFYYDHDVTGFDFGRAIVNSTSIVKYQSAGLEFELDFQDPTHHLAVSHGYTNMLDAEMESQDILQLITSAPYGYGKELTSWSEHITKLAYTYTFNEALSVTSSLRIYWGFDGLKSTQEFINEEIERFPNDGNLSDNSEDASSQGSYFLNVGAMYKTGKLSFHFDAHNILGWIREESNKRNFLLQPNKYRIEAPAFSLAVHYEF